VWVIADGVRYDPNGAYPDYTYAIAGYAHRVTFWAQCNGNKVSSDGSVLIDPDGYVFNITKGFDPISPTLHAVPGITVTAYVSAPEWGGWMPWPAQLYDNQVNPQVTGPDGYFAFFTPPGSYYLQVDDANGYQSWRSPVIQVITQVVHANVPLTPWTNKNVSQVTLTTYGPTPNVISITAGSTIEWLSQLSGSGPADQMLRTIENPILHPLSNLDPFSDTLSFDGGLLMPGQIYRRQFTTPGTYFYTDGSGHTAQIIVTKSYSVYLPVVRR
jgi:hypothetical protein